MKRHFDDYTRLARGLFGVSSLWLGPRDLLYVRGSGVLLAYAEQYLRFELDRIQSASVVRTRTGMVLNLLYGSLALVFGGLGGVLLWQAGGQAGGARVFLQILAGTSAVVSLLGLALLAVNWALGPTCLFQLQTATRIERLRPLRRLRPARRVLAQLSPLLLAAQENRNQ